MVTPLTGLPPKPNGVVSGGRGDARERTKFSAQPETKCSGLCGDDMQEQGVSKILTINLNDMARELKIK